MPFRDAGYSQADYGITVQDVVYGVWKAKEEGVCALENFDLDEYERFERVEHGDFNWITPSFLAFASPQHTPVARITEDSKLYDTLPRTLAAVEAHPTLPQPFKNVLHHFSERNIGLVVRLNSVLYSPSYFDALGIQHLDMIFEDGTCPPLTTVRKFIRLAHEMITVRKKGIAVHCKAGLGRTGCLIGAYLIYRHGFTANEVIAYMRFMRPGMVVGPQQHWLHLNQGTFREWWVEERIERKLRKEMAAANPNPSTPIRATQKANIGRSPSKTTTPPNRSASNRSPLSEIDNDRNASTADQDNFLPAPTPGQPRKAARHHPYEKVRGGKDPVQRNSIEEEKAVEQGIEIFSDEYEAQGADSDGEWHIQLHMERQTSVSPNSSRKSRSVSHSAYHAYPLENEENGGGSIKRAKAGRESPNRSSSASGVLSKVRGSAKRSPGDSLRSKEPAGVRKTSGRIGSIGSSATVTAANTARKISGIQNP